MQTTSDATTDADPHIKNTENHVVGGREGPAMWAYLLPMFSFLLVLEIGRRLPDGWVFYALAAQVLVPLGLLLFFRFRNAYPELAVQVTPMTVVDILLGVMLAVMWIVPYVMFSDLRPADNASSFDPAMIGAAWVPVVLAVRMFGYAVVTPWMEELFMRSFLIRYAYRFDQPQQDDGPADDFRSVPIGAFGWISFAVVVVVFAATHVPWEWWAMVPWAVLTNLWFYYRKSLFALIVVHAATNASILLAAIVVGDGKGWIPDLWFLV